MHVSVTLFSMLLSLNTWMRLLTLPFAEGEERFKFKNGVLFKTSPAPIFLAKPT